VADEQAWWTLYYRYGDLRTERFDNERDAVMFLHELDDAAPVAVHGPDGYKLPQSELPRRARELWEAENPEAAEAERRADEERRRQQQAEQARYKAWLAEQPDWYRTPVEAIKVTKVDHLCRVEINGVPLPFQVRHIEFQTDAAFGPDHAPALVLHVGYGDNLTVEYESHETRETTR
jgi:hypothetical protein